MCATFIWFARTYIQPYTPSTPEKIQEIEKGINRDVANFDKVIAEIYERLDDYEKELNDED